MRELYKSSLPMHFSPCPDTFFRNAYYPVCTFPVMHIRRFMFFAAILAAFVISGGCPSTTSPSTPLSPSGSSQPAQLGQTEQSAASSGILTLSVDSLSPGTVLPDVYTCKGTSASPPVSWSGIPAGTKSLVLILEDPDAPNGIYTHWVVYNIPPGDGELAQGQTNAKVLSNEAQQGESSNGFRGYYPPCPPIGSTHRYIFRLYAADLYFSLPTADRAAIGQALAGHTLATTEFTTTFKR
jgi:Raf kinase inhibitor-like YbhB/YbcL family protein